MGTAISSGEVSATITQQSVIGVSLTVASASRTTAGTTAIGTVPASKVWRIYGSILSVDAVDATESTGKITANSALINAIYCIRDTAVGYGTQAASTVMTGGNYFELSAGQVVNLVTTNGWDITGTIFYQELDA